MRVVRELTTSDQTAGNWYDDDAVLLAAVAAVSPDPGSSLVEWLGRQAYTWRTVDDELAGTAGPRTCRERRRPD
jgi:hypothetical protein